MVLAILQLGEEKKMAESLPVVQGVPSCEVESLIAEEKQVRLLYRQESILSEIEQLLREFDDAVLHLAHEKALTDLLMKSADLK